MKLLITTGATVTFKELVAFAVSDAFVDAVQACGFTTLYVQYGNEIKDGVHVSHNYINEQFRSTTVFKALELPPGEQLFRAGKLDVVFFPITADLGSYIEAADVIVSHGGTGTLIDILNHNKKLIVVYNENLMGNHQYEVAKELEIMNHCVIFPSSGLQIGAFAVTLDALVTDRHRLTPYSGGNGDVVQKIVYQELASSKKRSWW